MVSPPSLMMVINLTGYVRLLTIIRLTNQNFKRRLFKGITDVDVVLDRWWDGNHIVIGSSMTISHCLDSKWVQVD